MSVLTALPSTANFTSLSISTNAVATQSWVTSQAYLTALPSTANFTSLTISTNAVATQAWVMSQSYLTTLPRTASFSGNLSCTQLSCTTEIDTRTLSCTQLSCSSIVDTGGLNLSGPNNIHSCAIYWLCG